MSDMISIKPRKQRYMLYNAPLHKKRKWISSHLAENLLLKYDRRSLPVVKGDTVKVMRGNYRGHEDKISKVNVRDQTVEIEGVTITTAKGTKIAKPIHASTLLITKLNITDKWRRQKLESGLSETTKKEIEKEAAEQLKVHKAEQKAEEEAAKAEEKQKEETKEPLKEEVTTELPEKTVEPAVKEEIPEEKVEEKSTEPPKKKPATKKPTTKTTKKKKEEGET
ncbi:MAG: 50S ribosomal protein L24 [Thermoplasmata archaeon]|nr:50S ribosomal protein L24 [Thermoplasmata archaeon]MBE3137296.1 50S ribosomal protein L24 [Thermoplasmata archaeon]MBE3141758.1 50S ribosomal protein L24 [Thermoplasmata archaeon]